MKLRLVFSRTVVLFAILFALCASASGQEPPKPPAVPSIVGPAEIVIDRKTGVGTTTLKLRSAEQLDGWLTGRVNSDTEPKPQLTFKTDPSATNGEAVFQLTTDPKKITTIVATVTGVKQAGSFDADLAFEGNDFGKLKIVYLPFAVTVDGPDPNKADLVLIDEHVTSVSLKNDDLEAYPVNWRLNVNGGQVCSGQVTLPAKGIALLNCKASVPFSVARIQDLYKVESSENNSLDLYPVLANTNDQSSPWKRIPVKASLSYFGPTSQQFWGYASIISVLLLGGLTSLLLSQALPNRLKRLNVRERLLNAGRSTANLTSIGSRLQVLLRLERNRLHDILESRNTLSPDFASVAARCNEATTKLEARVMLAQQIDVVLERLEQKLTLGPPPSQTAAIGALIEDAKVLLAKVEPADKDLETAQTAIAEAAKRVDILNENDETFGQSLAKRVIEVQNDINTNFTNNPTFQKLNTALPGPLNAVLRVPANTMTISPAQHAELDMATEKLLLMKEYVLLFDGTQDKERRTRLDQNLIKLLGYLQLQSCPAMDSARLLMRQMKDDVYPDRLRKALEARSATIVMKPSQAYDKAPLEFAVCFNGDALEKAAAREEWTCQWAFGDNLNESGWSASHYFLLPPRRLFRKALPGKFTVKATFIDNNGDVLNDPAKNEPLTIEKQVDVRRSVQQGFFGDRARTELLKLMAALFIAVFALVSGAREQLMKLDILPGLIAVFTIGFGADTIKNLLTKTDTNP